MSSFRTAGLFRSHYTTGRADDTLGTGASIFLTLKQHFYDADAGLFLGSQNTSPWREAAAIAMRAPTRQR